MDLQIHRLSFHRHMRGHAACAFFLDGIQRVGPTGRTTGLVFNVSGFAEQIPVRWSGVGRLVIFQSLSKLRCIDVLLVDGASAFASRFNCAFEIRNRDGGQQTYDGDDDHNFDEGECALRLHGSPFMLR